MVDKAIIPAAGLGTRFLPATKAQPKEMMPVVDKPTIQYVVEEAIQSGIEDILIITGRGKRSIEAHFDKSYELERELEKDGKHDRLERIRDISNLVDIHYVRQKERKGLGDAVLYAEKHVGDEPFALLLGDTIVQGGTPCTERLVEGYEKHGEPVMALERVDWKDVPSYGIVQPENQEEEEFFDLGGMVEKPSREEAPSNLAITGRYVLTSDIFDLLRETEIGVGGELQLTDALRKLDSLRGYEMEGDRFDIGNIPDWLKANVELARRADDELEEFEELLKGVLDE